jgi:cell division protein FtsB
MVAVSPLKSLSTVIEEAVMSLYQSRRKLATCGVGVLACLLAYHVAFGANGLVVYGQKVMEYRRLRPENRSLAEQNQNLERQVKALKSDPQAIEKEARERLHYVRSGEVVYTFAPKPADTKPTQK